ncbi:cytochrome PufQ [Jannaschia pohangensis]|uniref:PufQ cytochrome subunit n=1 Tax=Jannaschia pohangensis TaxID=390807 RepID=A0A1I3USM9_9RHOB|nr:cytochrome PufQ [Jannaschia pohangensis]SFJ85046.1 PufQ cytochrome subunit [Jannaschia pohangensis]
MTDFTNADVQARATRSRHAPPMREYYAYFALIFVATLPLSVLTWTLQAARRLELPERGPIRAAWAQAQIITPRIFSA